MKIKEFVNEGVLDTLTKTLKNAPSRLSADTKLAADPSQFKSAPKKQPKPEYVDGKKQDPAAEAAKKEKLVTILKSRAQRTGNTIALSDIGKSIPKSGDYWRSPDELRDLVQSIAADLTAQGVKVLGKQKPGTAAAPVAPAAGGEQTSWDPHKQVLTISDPAGSAEYQRTRKGWKDVYTGDLIPAEYAKEIQATFDKVTGRVAPPKARTQQPLQPIQVKAPNGEIITKNDQDGKWYDEEGAEIVNDNDIAQLEKLATAQRQTRQMQR